MTSVEICNLALDNVKVTRKIQTLEDQTKEAQTCKRWYANVRDQVLRDYPWPFAARTKALVLNVETHPAWALVYDAPADALGPVPTVRRILPPGGRTTLTPIPFDVVVNEAGTGYLIACDMDAAVLEYTRKFDTDALVAMIPPDVVDAIAWKLASRLVNPLALDEGLIESSENMYARAVLGAYSVETMQRTMDPMPESEFITIRG